MKEVLIAFIGAIGIIGAATLPSFVTHRRIGKPNGKGNVIEMLEKVLDGQETQDTRLTAIETRQASTDTRLANLETHLTGRPAS